MATIYVDDTATGLNDGTSWTNAYTDFRDAWVNASEGDLILIDDGHDQTDVDLHEAYVSDRVVRVKSVDKADDSYSKGASLDVQQTLEISPVEWNGITFDFHHPQPQLEGWNVYNDCHFYINQATQFRYFNGRHELINCSFESHPSFSAIGLFYTSSQEGAEVIMRNVDLSLLRLDATAYLYYPYGMFHSKFTIEDTDLTDTANNSFDYAIRVRDFTGARYNNHLVLKNCRLPSFTNHFYRTAGTDKCPLVGHSLEFIDCYVGTDTDPAYVYLYKDYFGECELQSTVTRLTTDGVNSKSFKMTAYQSRCFEDSHFCARSGPMMVYVEETTTTITVHVAHTGVGGGTSGDLTNEEFWVEVSSPSEAATATSQGQWESTKCNFSTVTDLTDASSGEVWSGGSLTVYQKIDVTVAPTEAGWVKVTAFFALQDASSDNSIYVDFPEVA